MLVSRIDADRGSAFVVEHHYSHGIHNGPMCWGLFDEDRPADVGGFWPEPPLVGVIAFATPASEAVRASVWGPEHVNRVTELHRLVVLDEYGRNTESRFIAETLRQLRRERPDLWGVLSFADPTEGHVGVIYQATNALYTGRSARATFYRDRDGRLRHPRQNGVNISAKVAAARGWSVVKREGKHRYLFILGSARRRRELRSRLRLPVLPYPKRQVVL